MRRSRFSEEQIITILQESVAGAKTSELIRRHGIRHGDGLSGNCETDFLGSGFGGSTARIRRMRATWRELVRATLIRAPRIRVAPGRCSAGSEYQNQVVVLQLRAPYP